MILSIDSDHQAGFAAAFARALAKGIQVSEQKVSQRKTGKLAIEIDTGIHAAAVKLEAIAMHESAPTMMVCLPMVLFTVSVNLQ